MASSFLGSLFAPPDASDTADAPDASDTAASDALKRNGTLDTLSTVSTSGDLNHHHHQQQQQQQQQHGPSDKVDNQRDALLDQRLAYPSAGSLASTSQQQSESLRRLKALSVQRMRSIAARPSSAGGNTGVAAGTAEGGSPPPAPAPPAGGRRTASTCSTPQRKNGSAKKTMMEASDENEQDDYVKDKSVNEKIVSDGTDEKKEKQKQKQKKIPYQYHTIIFHPAGPLGLELEPASTIESDGRGVGCKVLEITSQEAIRQSKDVGTIQPGDVIVNINGTKVKNWKYADIVPLLVQGGEYKAKDERIITFRRRLKEDRGQEQGQGGGDQGQEEVETEEENVEMNLSDFAGDDDDDDDVQQQDKAKKKKKALLRGGIAASGAAAVRGSFRGLLVAKGRSKSRTTTKDDDDNKSSTISTIDAKSNEEQYEKKASSSTRAADEASNNNDDSTALPSTSTGTNAAEAGTAPEQQERQEQQEQQQEYSVQFGPGSLGLRLEPSSTSNEAVNNVAAADGRMGCRVSRVVELTTPTATTTNSQARDEAFDLIQAGDIVIAVDDADVSTWKYADIVHLLQLKQGAERSITFKKMDPTSRGDQVEVGGDYGTTTTKTKIDNGGKKARATATRGSPSMKGFVKTKSTKSRAAAVVKGYAATATKLKSMVVHENCSVDDTKDANRSNSGFNGDDTKDANRSNGGGTSEGANRAGMYTCELDDEDVEVIDLNVLRDRNDGGEGGRAELQGEEVELGNEIRDNLLEKHILLDDEKGQEKQNEMEAEEVTGANAARDGGDVIAGDAEAEDTCRQVDSKDETNKDEVEPEVVINFEDVANKETMVNKDEDMDKDSDKKKTENNSSSEEDGSQQKHHFSLLAIPHTSVAAETETVTTNTTFVSSTQNTRTADNEEIYDSMLSHEVEALRKLRMLAERGRRGDGCGGEKRSATGTVGAAPTSTGSLGVAAGAAAAVSGTAATANIASSTSSKLPQLSPKHRGLAERGRRGDGCGGEKRSATGTVGAAPTSTGSLGVAAGAATAVSGKAATANIASSTSSKLPQLSSKHRGLAAALKNLRGLSEQHNISEGEGTAIVLSDDTEGMDEEESTSDTDRSTPRKAPAPLPDLSHLPLIKGKPVPTSAILQGYINDRHYILDRAISGLLYKCENDLTKTHAEDDIENDFDLGEFDAAAKGAYTTVEDVATCNACGTLSDVADDLVSWRQKSVSVGDRLSKKFERAHTGFTTLPSDMESTFGTDTTFNTQFASIDDVASVDRLPSTSRARSTISVGRRSHAAVETSIEVDCDYKPDGVPTTACDLDANSILNRKDSYRREKLRRKRINVLDTLEV